MKCSRLEQIKQLRAYGLRAEPTAMLLAIDDLLAEITTYEPAPPVTEPTEPTAEGTKECKYSPSGKHVVERQICRYCEEEPAAPQPVAGEGQARNFVCPTDEIQCDWPKCIDQKSGDSYFDVECLKRMKSKAEGTPGSVLIRILGLSFLVCSLFQLTACRLPEGAVVFNGLGVNGSERIFKFDRHLNGEHKPIESKILKVVSGYRFLELEHIWCSLWRENAFRRTAGGLIISDADGNRTQGEQHFGRVNNSKRDGQSRGRDSSVSDISAVNFPLVGCINPLFQLGLLQSEAILGSFRAAFHSLSGASHLSRLNPDDKASSCRDQQKPPIGPLEGCVPLWRAGVGAFCILCSYAVVWWGRGRLRIPAALALIVGGTAIWLGKKVDCANTQNGSENTSFHGIIVTQKLLTSYNYCNTVIDMANILNTDKQIAIIGALRRLTRLTLAFSKKLENFEAAVGLHFAYYNFVRRHNTLRCTPAMEAGMERDFWSVGNLLEATA